MIEWVKQEGNALIVLTKEDVGRYRVTRIEEGNGGLVGKTISTPEEAPAYNWSTRLTPEEASRYNLPLPGGLNCLQQSCEAEYMPPVEKGVPKRKYVEPQAPPQHEKF